MIGKPPEKRVFPPQFSLQPTVQATDKLKYVQYTLVVFGAVILAAVVVGALVLRYWPGVDEPREYEIGKTFKKFMETTYHTLVITIELYLRNARVVASMCLQWCLFVTMAFKSPVLSVATDTGIVQQLKMK